MQAFGACLKVLKAITKHNESFIKGLQRLKDICKLLAQVTECQKLQSSTMNHLEEV